jgi:hypothetical protein
MIPRTPRRKQAPRTTPVADLERTFPDHDAAPDPGHGPARCPTCHRPWFDAQASGLERRTQDVLTDLKTALEEEVQP